MTDAQAGWYDDGTGTMRWWDGQAWTDQIQPPPRRHPHRMLQHQHQM